MQVVIEFLAATTTALGLALLSALGVDATSDESRPDAVVRKQAVSTLPGPAEAGATRAVHQSVPC